jgi:hypothetical protein
MCSHGIHGYALHRFGLKMRLYSYGLHNYCLYTARVELCMDLVAVHTVLYNYGLYSRGLYSRGLYSYGLHNYGLYSYGLYTARVELCIDVHMDVATY